MGAKRNTILGILTIAAFIGCGLMANAQERDSFIDYDGFLAVSGEVQAYRAGRLVSLVDFNEMKDDPDTIILDSRSPGAFAQGHIDGAINVNFSDFTDDKLAAVIPSRTTRILIYCNNNFEDNVAPIMLKSAPLALNVPTFINLYGYGYTNIYELKGMHSIQDPEINWVSDLDLSEH
ncbi:MAG: rhodanese-like domain-containing protein [Hyphomonas sp.]|uniref:rhodanese-like domain-containing protein n=1 Tax=Hyphomonas sp. TaxID=87 RepID=UPI0035294A7E